MTADDIHALRAHLAAECLPGTVFAFDYGNVTARVNAAHVCRELAHYTPSEHTRILDVLHGSEPHRLLTRGEITAAEFWEHLRRELDLTCTSQQFWGIYLETWTEPDPEILAIVGDLAARGHRVILLSNMDGATLAYLRARFPHAFEAFHRVVFSCEVGSRKPELRIYEIVQELERQAQRFVFIDNQWQNLLPPEHLGWHTILFQLSPPSSQPP